MDVLLLKSKRVFVCVILCLLGYIAHAQETVLDQFGSVSYSNSNGTLSWASDWTETGDGTTGAGSGLIQITGNQLRFGAASGNTNTGVSIQRSVDLSGVASATLSFSISQTNVDSSNDSIVIEASSDNFATITTLATFTNTAATTVSYSLNAVLASTTVIRFRVTNRLEDEYFTIDNVQISFTARAPGYKSVVLTKDGDGSGTVTTGDTLTYTVQYKNTGSSSLSNFQITDTLPTDVTLAATPTVTGATVNTAYTGVSPNNTLLAASTTLTVNSVISVSIPVVVNAGYTGTLSNQASATATSVTLPSSDNVDSTTTGLPSGITVPSGSLTQTQTTAISPTTTTVVAASAGTAFTCDATFYQTRIVGSTGSQYSQIFRLDRSAVPYTQTTFGTAPNIVINGMGYNVLDNYLYAIYLGPEGGSTNGTTSSLALYRIGQGGFQSLGPISNLPVNFAPTAADFDGAGNFYVTRAGGSTELYRINVTTRVATLITMTATPNLADMSFNPVDNFLYAVNNSPQELYKINPTTGAWTTVSITGVTSGEGAWGTTFFDKAGAFYAYGNEGSFYTINLTTGAATRLSSADSAARSDGASCVFPPPTVDVIKSVGTVTIVNSTTADVPYTIVIGNRGSTTASNVQVTENLGLTFSAGSPTITITSGPTATASGGATCTANNSATGLPQFDGVDNGNAGELALLEGTNSLAANASCTITFTARITYLSAAAVPTTAQNNSVYASSSSITNRGHTFPATGVILPPPNLLAFDTSTYVTNPAAAASLPTTSNTDTASVTPVTFGGAVSGTLYSDTNNNSSFDGTPTDTLLGANISVELVNSSNVVVATQQTNSSGAYTFSNVVPGSYTLRVVTTDTDLGNATATAPSTAQLSVTVVVLGAVTNQNFGFLRYDYGDAPASYGNASHIIPTTPTIYLGSVVPDAETSSGTNGTGDDTTGTDDEGGVTFPRMTAGQNATFSVVVAGTGFLNAWLDWNGDGDFADASEQIVTNLQDNGTGDGNTATGTISFTITVPATVTTTATTTYARFRWNSTSGLGSTGLATDGEVEDYAITTANVAITKTGTASVTVNGTVSYTVTVTNAGPANVTGVTITDTVPSYITVSSWTCVATGTATCGTASGTTNAISLTGNINAGAGNSLTIAITGIATTPGSVTNTARVTQPTGVLDSSNTNNSASQATTINAPTYTPPTLSTPSATPVCAVPGAGGDGTLSGVINTYYGSASTNQVVSAGSTSVNLEASRGAGTPISAGDLILFMQMQDATINTSDTRNYGGNNGSGSSYTSLGSTGFYEYVVATNNVPLTGGTLTFRGAGTGNGLVNTFTNADPSATRGQRTFQIIRVPQYANATISGTLSAVKWNGKSGGVVVVDVAGTLTWDTGSVIDVELAGFRAGYAPAATSGSSSGTLYRCSAKTTCGAGKGEGVAGTPANLWDGTSAITTGSGYPDGTNSDADYGMGAPANGGGGGGFHNAGGGGGSNGGAGGKGGLGWEGQSTTNDGGEPGVPLPPAINRLFMGGGGGGGDANNAASGVRGGVGAGIVLVRAGAMTGTGTVEADGDVGDKGVYQSAPDGAGGGGAGGSVLLYAKNSSSASVTVNARGGAGGNTENDNNNEHGPGGGGGGGLVVYNVPGGTVTTNLTGGSAGRANNGAGIVHGAQDGTPGHALTFTTTNDPFSNGGDGSTCAPQLTVAKATSTPTRSSSDATATYTITVTNATGKGAGRGIAISDDLPSPFTYAGGAITPVYLGGASGPASITGTGTDPVTFGTAGGDSTNSFTIPAGGSVALTFNVNINSASSATYQNPATTSYTDPTSATATVSPGGTDSLGQSVPGSNYASASSTNEDITISAATVILGIAKALDRIIHSNNAADNLYTLVYRLTLENFGSVTLSNLEINDDIVTQFSGLSPTNFNTWVNTAANAALLSPAPTLTLNGSWDGTASSNILSASQTLAAGQSKLVYISFNVTVNPAAASPDNQLRDNSATAKGTNPSSTVITDTSTEGTDPDGTDNDNNPDEDTVTNAPFVKLVKEVRNCGPSLSSCAGTYAVTTTGKPGDYLEYRIHYYNISSQAISTLVVNDDLVIPPDTAPRTPFQEDTYSLISPDVADFSITCPASSTVDIDSSDPAVTTTLTGGEISAFDLDVMAASVCNLTTITPGEQGYVLFKVKIP